MSESKHTPGPWKACQSVEGDFLGIYPATGKMEFPVAKMPEYITDELNQANASLIAAAPEMLGALKALQKVGVLNPTNSPRVKQAITDMVAAIKKAESHQ